MSPATVFRHLADATDHPAYFPRIASSTPSGEEKAKVTARYDENGGTRDIEGAARIEAGRCDRTLTWGSTGPDNHTGHADLEFLTESGRHPR